jgi:hypothetical protein
MRNQENFCFAVAGPGGSFIAKVFWFFFSKKTSYLSLSNNASFRSLPQAYPVIFWSAVNAR